MPDEEVQELGRIGVGSVKIWLESTTWLELPMNAYQDGHRCKVEYLGGKTKKFDLAGHFLGKSRTSVWVESKKYSGAHAQYKHFREFTAIAYAYTMRHITIFGECDDEFLWVTSHPFNLAGWQDMASHQKIKNAVEEFFPTENIEWDEEVARKLSERIWVLVWSEKQLSRLSLTNEEVQLVMATLNRKASPL